MVNLQGASKVIPVQRERLSEGDVMYCVYWIRKEQHTDIETEGYVGITKNFRERMRAHCKNRHKTPLTSAIKAYGFTNLHREIVEENITLEEALKIEKKLRPFPNIGWNLQTGGELGVDASWYQVEDNRSKHSIATSKATKDAIALKDTPEGRSNRAKESWKKTRDVRVKAVTGENNPKARLNEEEATYIKHKLIPYGLSNKEIGEVFRVEHYVISFIRSGKNWKHI
jgi:predicted GIY-YIG superfamily endonuclease